MSQPIHIVTRFDGIGGTENHAFELFQLLAGKHAVTLWADRPGGVERRYAATPIISFSGQRPEGGTLIILGTHLEPGIWLEYARVRRLVVICNLFSLERIFSLLALLDRPSLPIAEMVFVSQALKNAVGLPGIVCPPLIDLDRFHPSRRTQASVFRIGRHSRDDPAKHHPEDVSLYRMLAWRGHQVRIMGGECLCPFIADTPVIDLLKLDEVDAADYVANLDCFFYRTAPGKPEAAGRVIMEALASGTPVVASPAGGYVEWIEPGSNGYIVHNQEEAFERIVELAENPEKARRFSENARASAQQICGAASVANYLDWLCAA